MNFLAIARPFLFQQLQMLVVQPVRKRDMLFVPPVIASLVTTKKQYCGAPRIESVQDPIRSSFMLDSQLPHVAVPRFLHGLAMRKRQLRASYLE